MAWYSGLARDGPQDTPNLPRELVVEQCTCFSRRCCQSIAAWFVVEYTCCGVQYGLTMTLCAYCVQETGRLCVRGAW